MIDCRKIADSSGDAVQLANMMVQEQRRTMTNASSENFMRGEDFHFVCGHLSKISPQSNPTEFSPFCGSEVIRSFTNEENK